ncbi:MAG TPA: hypothetical protein VGW34_03260 [Allosphingosinicella sp.]|nr:hypothetical protein [Allosphingosinicella sp.]
MTKSKRRRATCRDPRKDTLPVLRAEIDELLRDVERLRRSEAAWSEAHHALREQYSALRRMMQAAIQLADASPILHPPCQRDDDDLPF